MIGSDGRWRAAKLAVAAAIALGAAPTVSAAAGRPDSGTAWVSATHIDGSLIWLSGDVSDKILGRAAIVYQTTVQPATTPGTVKVNARSVTLYTKNGSLTGTGSGAETTDAQGTTTISDGQLKLTRGTGKLAGHSLKGTFTGTFTNGIYTFTYTATYT
jgi:hypothetical protein